MDLGPTSGWKNVLPADGALALELLALCQVLHCASHCFNGFVGHLYDFSCLLHQYILCKSQCSNTTQAKLVDYRRPLPLIRDSLDLLLQVVHQQGSHEWSVPEFRVQHGHVGGILRQIGVHELLTNLEGLVPRLQHSSLKPPQRCHIGLPKLRFLIRNQPPRNQLPCIVKRQGEDVKKFEAASTSLHVLTQLRCSHGQRPGGDHDGGGRVLADPAMEPQQAKFSVIPNLIQPIENQQNLGPLLQQWRREIPIPFLRPNRQQVRNFLPLAAEVRQVLAHIGSIEYKLTEGNANRHSQLATAALARA
mmetsp:Transcript_113692/g.261008  ORF Transcript_113692/g.261008 Transcript_113692/m.261008 type:complete len:305 (-) Transcript_113692:383-1297(-)